MIRCFMRIFTGNGHYITGQHRWFSETELKILKSLGFHLENYQDWSATTLIYELAELIPELEEMSKDYPIRDPRHVLAYTIKCLHWECTIHPEMQFHIAKDYAEQPIRCPIQLPRSSIQRGGLCD